MKSIAVIGGGITGVTTAYALAKRGFVVTLFEKHRYAAMETSFANGGQLSASNAEVWNHGSTILKGLKWMLKSDAPLLVNPRPSWHKLSWFAEFIASIPHYRKNTVETARLAIAAREHLFAWAQAEGVDFDLRKEGILHIYRDKAGFDHAAQVSRLLAEGGLERRAVTPDEMRAIEPTLAGRYYGGFYTESDATGDIHKFSQGLALAIERLGVRCLYGQDVDRFRVAGTAEFNGYNKDIRDNRIRPLVDWVQQCFPGVSTRSVVPWAGLRPMLPNMMPRVGRGCSPCVFYNTGHGHLGWTLSAITADMVGDVVEQTLGVCGRVGVASAYA